MNSQTKYIAHGVYSCHADSIIKENPWNLEIIEGKQNVYFFNRSEDTSFLLVKGKELIRLDFEDGDYGLNYEATIDGKPVVYGILRDKNDTVKLILITRGEYFDIYIIVSTVKDL